MCRHIDRIDKAGAGGAQVECAGIACAKHILNQAGSAGEDIVRRRGRDNNQVERVRQNIRDIECPLCRLETECGGRLAFVGDITSVNAGALPDPFVGSLGDRGQILIGQNTFRQCHSPTDDMRVSPLSSVIGRHYY